MVGFFFGVESASCTNELSSVTHSPATTSFGATFWLTAMEVHGAAAPDGRKMEGIKKNQNISPGWSDHTTAGKMSEPWGGTSGSLGRDAKVLGTTAPTSPLAPFDKNPALASTGIITLVLRMRRRR